MAKVLLILADLCAKSSTSLQWSGFDRSNAQYDNARQPSLEPARAAFAASVNIDADSDVGQAATQLLESLD